MALKDRSDQDAPACKNASHGRVSVGAAINYIEDEEKQLRVRLLTLLAVPLCICFKLKLDQVYVYDLLIYNSYTGSN